MRGQPVPDRSPTGMRAREPKPRRASPMERVGSSGPRTPAGRDARGTTEVFGRVRTSERPLRGERWRRGDRPNETPLERESSRQSGSTRRFFRRAPGRDSRGEPGSRPSRVPADSIIDTSARARVGDFCRLAKKKTQSAVAARIAVGVPPSLSIEPPPTRKVLLFLSLQTCVTR